MQQFCASAAVATAPLLAQSHLLRNLRAGHCVIRGNHRIIPRQIPFRTILIGRHLVRTQVTLERLERLAVFQTDNVFGGDGALDTNRRLKRLRRAAVRKLCQRRVDLTGRVLQARCERWRDWSCTSVSGP